MRLPWRAPQGQRLLCAQPRLIQLQAQQRPRQPRASQGLLQVPPGQLRAQPRQLRAQQRQQQALGEVLALTLVWEVQEVLEGKT